MRKRALASLLTTAVFLFLHPPPAHAAGLIAENWPVPDHLPEFRVTGVIDGYTINVESLGPVAYHGLVRDQEEGVPASGLPDLTGKTVRVEKAAPVTSDGPTSGYVFADTVFINAYLVETGRAKTNLTLEDKYGGLFYLLQEKAKKKGLGLWAPEAPTFPSGGEEKAIVYITKTGTRYHQAGCRYLPAETSALTLAEAVARGYTPCRVCQPPGTVGGEETGL